MTKEDIKKVIKGRKIIDSIESPDPVVLTAKNDELKAIKDYTDARNIELREEIKTLQDKENQSIIKAAEALLKLGFKSIGEFMDYESAKTFEAYKEANPLDGFCDGCPHLAVAPCRVKYGDEFACFFQKLKIPSDMIYKIVWKGRRNNESETVGGQTRVVCPAGHGFFEDEAKRKTPAFDLNWRVSCRF